MAAMFEAVEVVCFDLDDTLWPCAPTLHKAETAVYDWLTQYQPEIPKHYLQQQLLEKRLAYIADRPDLLHDLTRLRLDFYRELFEQHQVPSESVAEQAVQVFRRARNQVEPFGDTVPALETLKRKYRLFTFSNGNAQVEKTVLAGYFENHYLSEQLGVAKPESDSFKRLAERIQVEPSNLLYVGDHPINDVDGARLAGCQACWINREGAPWPHDTEAPVSVRNLLELAAFLV